MYEATNQREAAVILANNTIQSTISAKLLLWGITDSNSLCKANKVSVIILNAEIVIYPKIHMFV